MMQMQAASYRTGAILGGGATLMLGWLLFWYSRNPNKFITLHLGLDGRFISFPTWLLICFIAAGYIMYTAKVLPFVKEQLWTFSWLKVIGLYAAIVMSTIEEILFRQIMMDGLAQIDMGIAGQITLSALAFGLAHSAWLLWSGNMRVILPVVISTTILGAMLALLYIAADRHVLAPIIAHILINIFIEPWLMLAVISGKWQKENKTPAITR